MSKNRMFSHWYKGSNQSRSRVFFRPKILKIHYAEIFALETHIYGNMILHSWHFFQRIGSHWGIQTRMNWEKHTFCHHWEKHTFCHHSGTYNKGHCCAICVICCVIRIGINNVWCALKCFLSDIRANEIAMLLLILTVCTWEIFIESKIKASCFASGITVENVCTNRINPVWFMPTL